MAHDVEKEAAARASLRFARDGAIVGLGSGSTATDVVRLLGDGAASLRLVCMARNDLLYQPRTREEELVNLSLAIITINGWNRLAIGFRKSPGEYQPHKIA
jgi:ribose 5-phosphate isomerase